MNRVGRIPFLILLSGALLLPFGMPAHAQDSDQQDAPATKQQDSGKKKDANAGKKNLRKLEKELATPYKKWLNEGVPYIISDEERRAFLRLQTNEEREQFIEAFWQRRDPTPDTVENEFKEEHYRRIAYANERFASGIPGWRTDRGRIYIIWGPPDELEAHPTGGLYDRPMTEGGGSTTTYAYEDWRYRHMDGVGDNIIIEFVDPSETGEYHMTMDPGEKDALAKDSWSRGKHAGTDGHEQPAGPISPEPMGPPHHWGWPTLMAKAGWKATTNSTASRNSPRYRPRRRSSLKILKKWSVREFFAIRLHSTPNTITCGLPATRFWFR